MAASSEARRVGLLGYGVAGRFFHAPLIAALPGLELAAVVTRNPQRQAEVRDEHPGAAVVDSAAELFETADRLGLDLVVVATPNRTHVQLAGQAIAARLPVVVDKPLAITAGDGQRLVDEAEAAGVPLTVFQNRRWDGDFLTVRRLIDEGRLGTVTRFESRFERWRPKPKPGWRESGDPDEGGGVLADLGSHLVDQALQLFGPVATVYAELDARRPGVDVDDDAFVALRHVDGTRSHLWMSAVAAQLGPRMRVLGTEAGYVTYGLDVQEAALREGRSPAEPGWGEEAADDWGLLGVEGATRREATEPGAYQRFYEAVERALRGEGTMPVDPREAVATLRVLEAARTAARTRQTVDMTA